ncbi:MAG TPA: hypothetical protein VOB72_21615 [Candidatus Dormibacteraeota bacterium]|nr:hypothetical protein [Candidatus Dormibacteraeota bacterium]
MTTLLPADRHSTTTRKAPWPLQLDAEVAAGATGITPRQAERLAELLARMPGLDHVSAEPHCGNRFVLVRMTVTADDLSEAVDLACASLHSCALDSGLSPLVLVAARGPR